jgi:hypothetical protein
MCPTHSVSWCEYLICDLNNFPFFSFWFKSDQSKDIQQNLRKEMNIVYPPTGYFLEVDLWLPELNLAFEFQVKKGKNISKTK